MSHALATVLHRGRKAASNIMSACLASSREARWETGLLEVRSASTGRGRANSKLKTLLGMDGWKSEIRNPKFRQPFPTISSGLTSSSNLSAVSRPSSTAASFSVVPSAWAFFATLAALS